MRIGASKLAALVVTILLSYSLAPVAPAAADNNLCKPSGKDGAIALPRKLATATGHRKTSTQPPTSSR